MQHLNLGISFVDATGTLRIIYGCPLTQRRELGHLLDELLKTIQQTNIKTLGDLYDNNTEFRAIAHKALSLCQIDPAWVSIQQLEQLILPYRDEEGKPKQPILHDLNFPDLGSSGGKSSTYEEAIAAIWSHTGDLEKAMAAANEIPWSELSAILEARNKLVDPKAREQAEMEEALSEIEKQGGILPKGMKIADPRMVDQMLGGR